MKINRGKPVEKYLKGIKLSELLARSFKEELSANEQKQMECLLEDFTDAEGLIQRACDKQQIAGKILTYEKFDSDRIWNELSSRLGTNKPKLKITRIMR